MAGTRLFSADAERYVIGGIFKDPKSTFEKLEKSNVTDEWFAVPRWRYTYQAIEKLKARGAAIEPSSVAQASKAQGNDTHVGTDVYEQAIDACKDVRNVDHYLEVLKDYYAKRILEDTANMILREAHEDKPADEIVGKIKWTLSSGMPETKAVKTVDERLEELGERYSKAKKTGTSGIPYRWPQLNDMTAGAPRGKVIVVGSRPKCGKTMFMCNQMFWLAKEHNMPVGIIELEMQDIELRERFIGDDLGAELFDYRRGKATKQQIKEFISLGKKHKDLPIHIYDGNRTIENICMVIRDMASEVRVWAIDYMQRIKQSRLDPKSDRERYERYSNLITDVANETGVTIYAVCQLNREAEFDMKGKRVLPSAKTLKGSGAFEQDAHQVILIGRDICLDGESEMSVDQPCVCRVVYNRSGHSGDIPFLFRKQMQRMDERVEAASK